MHDWNDIRGELAERDPGFEEGVTRERGLLNLEHKLYNLRRGRGVSQTTLAGQLGMTQENVSRIERAEDLQLTTLANYICGLGGRLELVAVFDNDAVVLTEDLPSGSHLPTTRPRSRDRIVPANSARRTR
jgi:DNA-binding XRE family transcriptional regulator